MSASSSVSAPGRHGLPLQSPNLSVYYCMSKSHDRLKPLSKQHIVRPLMSVSAALTKEISAAQWVISTGEEKKYDRVRSSKLTSTPSLNSLVVILSDLVSNGLKNRETFRKVRAVGKLLTLVTSPTKSPVPVVAKATTNELTYDQPQWSATHYNAANFISTADSVPMPHLEQTHENLQRFCEHQAGADKLGILYKNLSAEETAFTGSWVADTLPKLRMPEWDFKEDRLTTSAQSTPSGTPVVTPSVTPSVTPCVSPHTSPAVSRRSWFQPSPAPFLAIPDLSPNPSTDMGGNEGGGGERWSFFGSRSVVQKSPTDPGSDTSTGFSLQSYFGLQKSSTMDGTNTQVNLKVEDPANFMPPKIDISGIEAKRVPPRPHKLKPRDMNVLTPSGF
ncbi:putative monooxygenase p33MONOX [Lates japonicus]|uniref:Putative monooxygenase p33MONOX n=1 Tax=Lates japonicus TaxID=270547 RepID=A0AAD3RIY1_LATJO|nr:putative monooxygenase p33MONOX [Lates japonicus]